MPFAQRFGSKPFASSILPSFPAMTTSIICEGGTPPTLTRVKSSVRPVPPRSVRTRKDLAGLCGKMRAQRRVPSLAQALGSFLHDLRRDGRHSCGGGSGPGGKGKDVKMRQAAVIDERKRVSKHVVRLGRKTRDDVGAKHDLRPQLAQTRRRDANASARRWRRFMRFKIRSSPDCSDR